MYKYISLPNMHISSLPCATILNISHIHTDNYYKIWSEYNFYYSIIEMRKPCKWKAKKAVQSHFESESSRAKHFPSPWFKDSVQLSLHGKLQSRRNWSAQKESFTAVTWRKETGNWKKTIQIYLNAFHFILLFLTKFLKWLVYVLIYFLFFY